MISKTNSLSLTLFSPQFLFSLSLLLFFLAYILFIIFLISPPILYLLFVSVSYLPFFCKFLLSSPLLSSPKYEFPSAFLLCLNLSFFLPLLILVCLHCVSLNLYFSLSSSFHVSFFSPISNSPYYSLLSLYT